MGRATSHVPFKTRLFDGVRFLGWAAIAEKRSPSPATATGGIQPHPRARLPDHRTSAAWSRSRDIERAWSSRFSNATVQVEFLADDLVKLSWTPGKRSPDYAISRHTWPAVKINRTRGEEHIVLTSTRLSLRLAHTGAAAFYDMDGNPLRQDDPPQRIDDGWSVQSPLRRGESSFRFGGAFGRAQPPARPLSHVECRPLWRLSARPRSPVHEYPCVFRPPCRRRLS